MPLLGIDTDSDASEFFFGQHSDLFGILDLNRDYVIRRSAHDAKESVIVAENHTS